MKNIPFFLLMFLLSNNSFCQEVFDEASMTIEGGNIINEAHARIVRTDTTIKTHKWKNPNGEKTGSESKWQVINHYDSSNKLVMEESKGIPLTSTYSGTDLFIYDANNNFILESRNDHYGATWLLALYKYKDMGSLTSKKYWNEESIGKMIYDNPKKPKKYTFYNCNGKKVRSWKKARRKVPYKMPKYVEDPVLHTTAEKTK